MYGCVYTYIYISLSLNLYIYVYRYTQSYTSIMPRKLACTADAPTVMKTRAVTDNTISTDCNTLVDLGHFVSQDFYICLRLFLVVLRRFAETAISPM